jgi:NADPH:quinone reductase-like Zn-dependent oxidoreductase
MYGALRQGGMVIGFGFMGAPGIFSKIAMFANLFIGARLRGRQGTFYGISALYKKDPKPLREDMPKIFSLLADNKIDPLITHRFALLEGRKAIELLAKGSVEGKIVLIA